MFSISLTVTTTITFPDCTSRGANNNVRNNLTSLNNVRNFMKTLEISPAYWLRYKWAFVKSRVGVQVWERFTRMAQMIQRHRRLQLCLKQWHHLTSFTTDKDTSINMLFILRKILTHIWRNKCMQTAQICFKIWTDIWYYCYMRNCYAVIRMNHAL